MKITNFDCKNRYANLVFFIVMMNYKYGDPESIQSVNEISLQNSVDGFVYNGCFK